MTTLDNEVVLLQSDANYTHLIMNDGTKTTRAKTLKSFEEDLMSFTSFIRPNKSCIINLEYFQGIDDAQFLMLTNGVRIKIARRRLNEVMKALKDKNI